MGNLNQFFRDLGRNAYGLGENVASLGSAAIAEPVAGFAAMYDPANGAQAIREGMTYTPRTQAGQMYQQGAARTLGTIAQPAMPVIDTWQRGVDIAGGYSPVAGAMLRTVPAAIGVAMGAKPALQAGRQMSNSLGAMQARMVANANAPRTLNTGYMGQRGAIGTQRPLTEFEQAHLLAQQRAALPVNQGGLGLPANNTAMERARAMGFDVDAFTGVNTTGEIDSMLPKSWFSEQSKYASDYSNVIPKSGIDAEPRVYPVILKTGNVKAKKYTGLYDDMESALSKKRTDTFKVENVGGGNNNFYVIKDPKNIRSRFAAFDPFNRDSSNLLAQSAKLAPAATLGALMANEKRKDKRN